MGTEEQKAFELIKGKWSENLELIMPDQAKPFELECDASDVIIGAVLRQARGPIAYISRALTKAERNYSITERELLAAIWAMEKFKYYLTGREFVLLTDRKAIEEVKRKREFGNGRIYRWFERLEQFQFK